MKWTIYENGETINTIEASAEFVETYCEENGYTYEQIIEPPEPEPLPEPEPMTQAEIEETLLDQEYRLLLLEYGLEEEEPI